MEANFTKAECPRCKYVLADKSSSKDGAQEHFICLRCGYHHLINNGERQEHLGVGAWMIVSEKGVYSSAVYTDEKKFHENLAKLRKAIQGGKLFYTRKDSIGKYMLVDYETGIKHEFGNDDEICFEGLRKIKT